MKSLRLDEMQSAEGAQALPRGTGYSVIYIPGEDSPDTFMKVGNECTTDNATLRSHSKY
jgi:hypothetical protein